MFKKGLFMVCVHCPSHSEYMQQQDSNVMLFLETPEMYASNPMQDFIQQEAERPTKDWVNRIARGVAETEHVKVDTDFMVLLPDISTYRRAQRHSYRLVTQGGRRSLGPYGSNTWPQQLRFATCRRFHWLAILKDDSIRSIRDLRGKHIPMLEEMQKRCIEAIQQEHMVEPQDVMVFANYHPSVYRIHFHFCAPFLHQSPFDAFRMHSLATIINNLRINSDYYALSTFQIPVHTHTELYAALRDAHLCCLNNNAPNAMEH